jgi:hypothetical protein
MDCEYERAGQKIAKIMAANQADNFEIGSALSYVFMSAWRARNPVARCLAPLPG